MQTEINNGPTFSSLSGYQTLGSGFATALPNETFGVIHWLDEAGRIKHSWGVFSDYVTIGSSSGCSVSIDGMGLELVHGAISFGKNHILVQSIEGQVRIGGRQIREWLIDEPTVVFFGVTKLQIVPAIFLAEESYASHKVTPGSMSVQAARLQHPSVEPLATDPMHVEMDNLVQQMLNDSPGEIANSEKSGANASEASSAVEVVQKHVVHEVNAALEPIRDSLEAIRTSVVDGLRELSTNLVDRYEQRFQETSAVIDHRFERIESLLIHSHGATSNATEGTEAERYHSNYSSSTNDYHYTSQDELALGYGKGIETEQPSLHYKSEDYRVEPVLPNPPGLEQEKQASNFATSENALDTLANTPRHESYQEELDRYASQVPREIADNYANNYSGSYVDNHPASMPRDFSTAESEAPQEANSYGTGYLPDESPEEFAGDIENIAQRYEAHADKLPTDDSAKLDQLNTLYSREATQELPLAEESYDSDADQLYADRPGNSESELPAWFTLAQNESPEINSYSDLHNLRTQEAYGNHPLEDETLDYNSELHDSKPHDSELERLSQHDPLQEEWGLMNRFNPEAETHEASQFSQEPSSFVDPSSLSNFSDYKTQYEEEESKSYTTDQVEYASDESTYAETHSNSQNVEEEEEEESIEVYMQRLLQRVKGEGTTSSSTNKPGSESKREREQSVATAEVVPAYSSSSDPATTSTLKNGGQIRTRAHTSESEEVAVAAPPTTKITRNVPRVSVEQQQESLAALRELANHTARRAINHNTKKRIEGHLYGKLMISGAGLLGGTILLIINGITPNVAMAGMICAYAVFLLWGYDAWLHSRRLIATKNEDEVEQV